MFFWKGHSVFGPHPQRQPQMKHEEQGTSSKILRTVLPSLDTGCCENIDRTVFKVLTKKTRKRSGQKQKTAGKPGGWRGPREQLSEAPAQRKGSTKKSQEKYQVISNLQSSEDVILIPGANYVSTSLYRPNFSSSFRLYSLSTLTKQVLHYYLR